MGYNRKADAKRALLASGLIENQDFRIKAEPTTTGIQAHPNENITLTTDAFKLWAMMAGTPEGKQVRLYFLDCEKQLRHLQKANVAKAIAPTPTTDALVAITDAMERFMQVSGSPVPPELTQALLRQIVDSQPSTVEVAQLPRDKEPAPLTINYRSFRATLSVLMRLIGKRYILGGVSTWAIAYPRIVAH